MFMIGGIVSLVIFLLLIWRINQAESLPTIPDEFTSAILFVAIGGSVFIWFLYALKCPACRKGIALYVLNSAQTDSRFASLLSLRECPFCGFPSRDKGTNLSS
jgi:hypothetical protein